MKNVLKRINSGGIKHFVKVYEWWAEMLGRSISAATFYKYLFKELWDSGKVYNRDIPHDWPERSRERWITMLVRGTTKTIGFQIIQRRKEGRGGKVFYVFDPMFLARINRTWLAIKKNIR